MAAAASAFSGCTDPSKVRHTVVLKPTGVADSTKAWVAEAFYRQPAHTTPNRNSATTPTRKSKRSAMSVSADQDSIEKAARLKARKNLEETDKQGSIQGDTLLWFRALLQHIGDRRVHFVKTCQLLESRAMHFFASYGWPFFLRIGQ
nr:uncharacterized protein LOC117846435 [Setaria viridis]